MRSVPLASRTVEKSGPPGFTPVSRPPVFRPRPVIACPFSTDPHPADLSHSYAADPFDARMRERGPVRLPDGRISESLVHSSLGLLVEIHHWLSRPEHQPIPESFQPMMTSIREHLDWKLGDSYGRDIA